MKSSESSSFSSVSSSSSLNSSTVESFQFSPCHENHRCCTEEDEGEDDWSPFKAEEKHQQFQDSRSSQSEISELFSSDEERGKKQTLGELMKLHIRSESHEEELLLLGSRAQQRKPSGKPPRPLLVQALCGSRKTTGSSVPLAAVAGRSLTPATSSHPRLQRSNASTRRRCSTPSPLRNSGDSSQNSTSSACCGGRRKSDVVNHVVNCTVVRSKSSGNIPRHGEFPAHELLTKSKSVGAAVVQAPAPPGVFSSRRSMSSNNSLQRNTGRSSFPVNQSLFQSWGRSTSTHSSSNPFQSRSSSTGGRSSFTYSKTSSVSSSSNGSLLSAIDRYHQHRNTEAEHKRRNSFLPYKSALLSLFFPLPSFWSHQPTVHHHPIRTTIT